MLITKTTAIIAAVYFLNLSWTGSAPSVSRKQSERKRYVTAGKEDDDDGSTSMSSSSNEDSSRSSENMADVGFFESNITASFFNKRTFACPRIKPYVRTGDSIGDLSPEDIEIIAAMGDSVAAGKGLWLGTDIEARGAAFPIGGDADIDDIVTIPNVLREFSNKLEGQSHGMGTLTQLPDSQLNCAESGARTSNMLAQAEELIHRLHRHYGNAKLTEKWLLVIVTIGTDEICTDCSSPDYGALRSALEYLQKSCPRSLIVLVGPLRPHLSQQSSINILRRRCKCMQSQSAASIRKLFRSWTDFYKLQDLLNKDENPTFGVVAFPFLSITDSDPESFFIQDSLLLSRKGHTYAARWLWNRLLVGANKNGTSISSDSFYCPSPECPYFRTAANSEICRVRGVNEGAEIIAALEHFFNDSSLLTSHRRENMRQHLLLVIVIIFISALISVLFFGSIFYQIGLRAKKSRFDVIKGV